MRRYISDYHVFLETRTLDLQGFQVTHALPLYYSTLADHKVSNPPSWERCLLLIPSPLQESHRITSGATPFLQALHILHAKIIQIVNVTIRIIYQKLLGTTEYADDCTEGRGRTTSSIFQLCEFWLLSYVFVRKFEPTDRKLEAQQPFFFFPGPTPAKKTLKLFNLWDFELQQCLRVWNTVWNVCASLGTQSWLRLHRVLNGPLSALVQIPPSQESFFQINSRSDDHYHWAFTHTMESSKTTLKHQFSKDNITKISCLYKFKM